MATKSNNKEIVFVDNGGLAPAKHFCPHIGEGITMPTDTIKFPDLCMLSAD